jgi:hypothetical protein
MTTNVKIAVVSGIAILICFTVAFGWNLANLFFTQNESSYPEEEQIEEQIAPQIGGILMPGEVDTQSVEIGAADKVSIIFAGQGGPLKVALITPKGDMIDSANAGQFDSTGYINEGEIEGFAEGIFFSGFIIANKPVPGVWKIIITPADPGKEKIGYTVTARLENPAIRLTSASNKVFYKNGEPIIIMAYLTNQSEPLLGANVKAKIIIDYPYGPKDSLVLHDDGLDGDMKASDGTYSGIYKNTNASADYWFFVMAENSPNHKFSLQSSFVVRMPKTKSSIIGVVRDYGQDTDGDTLFDSLRFDIDLDISPGQEYTISADLCDKNNKGLGYIRLDSVFTEGKHTVSLAFDGEDIAKNRVDGPYILENLSIDEITDGSRGRIEIWDMAGKSKPYLSKEFQYNGIFIDGKHADYGIDSDSNGLFDSLRVEIDAELRYIDDYHWSIYLYDKDDNQIDMCMSNGHLDSGKVVFAVTFDGGSIADADFNGPYQLSGFGMYGDKGGNTIYAPIMYTQPYQLNQFEKRKIAKNQFLPRSKSRR